MPVNVGDIMGPAAAAVKALIETRWLAYNNGLERSITPNEGSTKGKQALLSLQ
jgi:hypothetical protein